jgi:type I restriction enzyme S subunit
MLLLKDVVSFIKADDEFGGLSNLSSLYPLKINGLRILTTEHLYQALKFPDHPEIQSAIISSASATEARKISRNGIPVLVRPTPKFQHTKQKYAVLPKVKPVVQPADKTLHQSKIRPDWDEIRLEVMEYCLRAKLISNWVRFGDLLRSTGSREIVQRVPKTEPLWGVFTSKDGVRHSGHNHLGHLLMKLRDELHSPDNENLRILVSSPHLNLKLLDKNSRRSIDANIFVRSARAQCPCRRDQALDHHTRILNGIWVFLCS